MHKSLACMQIQLYHLAQHHWGCIVGGEELGETAVFTGKKYKV